MIRDDYELSDFNSCTLILGGNEFHHIRNILKVKDERIIYFNIDSNGYTLLNATFYDEQNRKIAEIIDNELITYLNENIWDIDYSSSNLKISSAKYKILLELKVDSNNNSILINADIYAHKHHFEINEKYFRIDKSITLSGNYMGDSDTAICIGGHGRSLKKRGFCHIVQRTPLC